MASKRMFSKRVVTSARFLKMPISTQALYFHLGLQADDDGVVEAYTVINSVGASEDDLRVLVAKGFCIVLNEDLVTYITDWHENNRIRPDRKIDSMYKDLLIQVLPDVELVEKRPRSDSKAFQNALPEPMDSPRTVHGQPMDGIGKVRLGKDSIDKDRVDYEAVKTAFTELCPSFPVPRTMPNNRKTAIKARIDDYGMDGVLEAFRKAEASDFLKGKNDRKWKANMDWILKDANMAKILDGNYDNREEPKQDDPNAEINAKLLEMFGGQ